jgi:hypothetical protein
MEDMEKKEEDILLKELERIQELRTGNYVHKERIAMIIVWLAILLIGVIFWIGMIKILT